MFFHERINLTKFANIALNVVANSQWEIPPLSNHVLELNVEKYCCYFLNAQLNNRCPKHDAMYSLKLVKSLSFEAKRSVFVPNLILSYMTKTTMLRCTGELEMCQMKGKKKQLKSGLLFICHHRRSGLIGNIFSNTAIIHGHIPGFVVNFVSE